MRRSGSVIVVALAVTWLFGCATLPRWFRPVDPAFDVPFTGPGRLVLVIEKTIENANPDEEIEIRRLAVVYGDGRPWVLPLLDVDEVRWLGPRELLVSTRMADDDTPGGVTVVLNVVDVEARTLTVLGPGRAYYNVEPSPDGAYIALGVQTSEEGESEIRIYERTDMDHPLVASARVLDEPRWSPDGYDLVFAKAIQDRAEDGGPSFGSIAIAFPRLLRARRDLVGSMERVHDGAPGESAAKGGSYPVWWGEDGIYARQRGGLVRCDAERGGCTRVYSTAPKSRILEGRRVGAQAAWLLVLNTKTSRARDANEIHRVNLGTGAARILFEAPPGVGLIDVDWTGP